MAIVSAGFTGRHRGAQPDLPPGQHLVRDFPVLAAGPTQHINHDRWEFSITTEAGVVQRWSWAEFMALPVENISVDIHCVTSWSKLGTYWRGVSLDTLLADVKTEAGYVTAFCYGGYTTNLPLADLRGGQAWLAFEYDGRELTPEHGGPVRLLVPHLYFWKSAKWVQGLRLREVDEPGFWERVGYHNYGDPWREQRYWDS
jgi:DMSO/TMAO reductase YedYZ molybdopterin-dependent catalytic subunit